MDMRRGVAGRGWNAGWRWALGATGLCVALAWRLVVAAQPAAPPAAASGEQTVLGPGLYVYQTRTRTSSCGDDERTGFVSSFVAPIHGVPGSRSMEMTLLNSPYWSRWTITIDARNEIHGESFLDGSTGPSRPTTHFVVTRSGDRFTGEGSRSYDGAGGRRCTVTFDALLRRLDG